MRRVVLLAGGALLAGAGLFMKSGPAPRAAIEGGSLEAKAAAPDVSPSGGPTLPDPNASSASTSNAPGATAPAATQVPAAQAPAEPAKKASLAKITDKVVSAALGDVDLELDKLRLENGHYVAPTKDGRLAQLTLDPDLQALAEKLLDESRAPRGAIVAMTPDGKILAFAGRRTEANKGGKDGIHDASLVTSVWAPAASIFKLVTASALLSHGYDPDQKVCYHGGVRSVMESNLSDSKLDGNCETLQYGVAHSNNAILGKLAYQNLEPSMLDRMARDFGWANTLPGSFGVAKASCGELALPEQKDLEFAKSAAGFLGSRLSVIGGALLGATFAHGGEQPAPYMIESIDGKSVVPGPDKTHRVLTKEVADKVTRMMVETCESGSASRTFHRHKTVTVAGKTGTLATDKPFYMEHSWFVGFAPADQPEVVVSVLLGNPQSWYLRGHEAAKRMIDRALSHATRRAEDRDDEPTAAKP